MNVKRSSRKSLVDVGSLACLWASSMLVVSSCAVNPVTGRREFSLLSKSQEKEVGAQNDQAVLAEMGEVNAPALAGYVRDVGQAVLAKSHEPGAAFTFRLMDDPTVNAFALPGGYVYLTRGILAYLNNEAAMAGVLGHEVGHVMARHGADRYTKQVFLGLGVAVGGALSGDLGEQLLGAAGQLTLLKYGRDDERQSDKLGVEYATKAGYDTREMADFFRTLSLLNGGAGRLPAWTSSHPDPGERFETVNKLSEQAQAGLATRFNVDREKYLRAVDGIVFGKNPREGFEDAGWFKHPDLDFQFVVPPGWLLQNSKSKVVLAPQDRKSTATLTLAEGASAAAAADALAKEDAVQELERQTLTVNGMPAVRAKSRITVANQPVATMAVTTFIERGGKVYAFVGLAQEPDFAAQLPNLVSIADSFAPLADAAAKTVRPMKIKVVTANADATLAEIVKPYPLPALAQTEKVNLGVLNGMSLEDKVQKGTLVKVVVQ
ncbi:MAG: M48 family metalloprotease [Myxococcales bacterium]|nr:M48 family metalloprotease [Myxococcales bacterium]